jgi:SAM-dependent methyltransferase
MVKRKSIIEQYNDRLAPLYEEATKGEFQWFPPEKMARAVLPLLAKKARILDLGVGTGQSSAPFIKKGHLLVGVDISAEMLNEARRQHKFENLYKHDIRQGLKGLGFRPHSFDVILSVGILEFVKNIDVLAEEVRELLSPKGLWGFTYEGLVPSYWLQSKRAAPLGEGLSSPIPRLLTLMVYRRSSAEMKQSLLAHRFNILIEEPNFVGYFKSQQKLPVYYGLFVARK